MTTSSLLNPAYKDWLESVVNPYETITLLEKSEVSDVDLSDIAEALDEYVRLFKAEIASPAEILTLSRAYPDEEKYSLAVIDQELDQEEPVVIGGPASVEVVDREGHLITLDAMKRAFERFMANFRTRNAMVLHSDVQVGWALPAYISKTGKIYKSGVTGDHLFFITELRNDTKISKKVLDQINTGKMKSYSIAGSATSVEPSKRDGGVIMQVNDMELAEVTICEQGVNQRAKFELMKSDRIAQGSCVDGSCLIKSDEHVHSDTELLVDENGIIDTVGSFTNWVQKEFKPDYPGDTPEEQVSRALSRQRTEETVGEGEASRPKIGKHTGVNWRETQGRPYVRDYPKKESQADREIASSIEQSRREVRREKVPKAPYKSKGLQKEAYMASSTDILNDYLVEKGIGDIARGAGKAVGAAVEGVKNVGREFKSGVESARPKTAGEASARMKPPSAMEPRGEAGVDPNVTIRDRDASRVGKGFKEYMARRKKENPAAESPSGRINYNPRTGYDAYKKMQKSVYEYIQKEIYKDPEDNPHLASPSVPRLDEDAAARNRARVEAGKGKRKATQWTRESAMREGVSYDPSKRKENNKDEPAGNEVLENMQKTHLAGCMCDACKGIAERSTTKIDTPEQRKFDASDTARIATDRHGRPTLGHTGHGNVVSILISRMQRKAGPTKGFTSPYEKHPDEPRTGAEEIREGRNPAVPWWETEKYPDQVYDKPRRDSSVETKKREKAKAATKKAGLEYAGMRKAVYEYINKTEKPSLKTVVVPQHDEAAAAENRERVERMRQAEAAQRKQPMRTRSDYSKYAPKRKMGRTGKVDLLQKAVYEYIHKAYKVPSREELAAAAKKRKTAALTEAKEKYKDFKPTEPSKPSPSQSSPFRRRQSTTPTQRKEAALAAAKKKYGAKFQEPKPETETQGRLLMEKGIGDVVSGAAKTAGKLAVGAGKVGARLAAAPVAAAEALFVKPTDPSTGERAKQSRFGRLADFGESASESRIGQAGRAAPQMNMEKQEPEWTTPQTQTPLHKFLEFHEKG